MKVLPYSDPSLFAMTASKRRREIARRERDAALARLQDGRFKNHSHESRNQRNTKDAREKVNLASEGPTFYWNVPLERDPENNPVNFPGEWKHLYGRLWVLQNKGKVVGVMTQRRFDEMSEEELRDFRFVGKYLVEEENFCNPVKTNAAMINGYQGGVGYRKSQCQERYGYYRVPAKVKNNIDLLFRWFRRLRSRPRLEKIFAQRFRRIATPIFKEQRQQALNLGIHTFGDIGTGRYRRRYRIAGNLSFTMRNFQTKWHLDNDAEGWTYGMWIPVFTEDGRLAYWTDGWDVKFGDFCWPGFGARVRFDMCDGVTEIIWRGSRDRHGTEASEEPSGKFTRLGTSVQISQRLSDIVTGVKTSKFSKITTPLMLARQYLSNYKKKVAERKEKAAKNKK